FSTKFERLYHRDNELSFLYKKKGKERVIGIMPRATFDWTHHGLIDLFLEISLHIYRNVRCDIQEFFEYVILYSIPFARGHGGFNRHNFLIN
ncbi:hypothetical protein ACJX0J_037223, partial [Zea mays]